MKSAEDTANGSLLDHIIELRQRLLSCIVCIVCVFGVLIIFATDIYDILAIPVINSLGENRQLIATEITSPLLSPLKLALILSLYLSMPVILYHGWAYVAPALYKHEKSLVLPLLLISSVLFYSGPLFCYFVVFPLTFSFIQSVVPESVAITPDIHQYLTFSLKLFFSFGLAFQVPVLVVLLVRTGIVTHRQLATKRRHVALIALTVGMLLTPPDIISQTLLTLPVLFLFESGLLLSRVLPRAPDEPGTEVDTP